MSSKNSINDYAKKEEKGWYLLVTHKVNGVVQNLNYKKIKEKDMENITTTALDQLKEDGFLNKQNVNNLLDYEVTLLYYCKGSLFSSENKLFSRYIMKYKQKPSGIDGYYDSWEYTVVDKIGNFKTFDKNYNYWKAHQFPLIISILQILFMGLAYFIQNKVAVKYYNETNVTFTFLIFFLASLYSAFSVWKKDLIKRHYLKDNLKRILFSIATFEIPVLIATGYTVLKMSQFAGKFTWPIAIIGIGLIIVKIACTYDLEKVKKRK